LNFPDFDPAIFTIPQFHLGAVVIGPLAVRWYALAYVAGILLGWRYGVMLVKNQRLWGARKPTATPLQIDDLILWITLGVILGGRIGYVLFYMLPVPEQRAQLAADWTEVFKVWHGGMSFHGGAIGVMIAVAAFAVVNRIDMLKLGDLTAPCVPIGLFFGRIANFINGELWGRETSLPWGVVFCNERLRNESPNHACPAGDWPRHPSQLYEAALEGMVIFAVLALATWRWRWLRRRGALTGMFLTLYGMFRIMLEGVRNPDPGLDRLPLGLTMGMLLSAPMVIVGVFLLWLALRAPLPPESEGGDASENKALPDAHEPA
jgi:phosphatidylglycerol:prolipoprotein diacylglycerol transferase